ncbi:MAG: protein kinase domain-containing protein [Caldimonas sp.]
MTPADLSRLSTLLDQALDLPMSEREAWLAALDGEALALAPTLRDLLARSGLRNTDDLLDRGPAFELPSTGPQPGEPVGPYRLLRELGTGGMGAVWLAERSDGSLKRKVALKLPHLGWAPGLAERFAREREILSSLEHPHIARLYDAGLDQQGRPYMALEYVEGQAIDVYCRERALSVVDCLRMLLQVAEAVAFAHSRLVLHRDLKPANILVTADRQVRLLDFGVAKLMQGETASETALTRASGRAMTLDYASPEQVRGEPLGTASDVYSLGVVAFELLAGLRPYRLKRGSAAELEEAITAQEIPAASTVAATPALRRLLRGDLDSILGKALKKQPGERYASVDALAQDWRHYLDGARVAARPDRLYLRLGRFSARHRTPLLTGGLAMAAFVLALGFGATALVVASLLAGLGAALWQARRAREQARVARSEARTAQAVQTFLLELFQATSTQQKDPVKAQQTTARELLEIGAKRIAQALADAPESRVRVLRTLGEMHWQIGLRPEAARLKLEAVEVARGAFGSRDLRFGRAALDCANALEETPHRDQIPALLEAADAAFAAAGEPASHDRAEVLRQLSLYYRYESLPESLRTAEQAVAVLVSRDAGHQELINTYRSAGRARIIAGDFGIAEQHYRAAVAVADAQGEGRATWLVNARAELAEALFKQGQFEAADREGRAAVDLSLQAHGPAHRWTLIVRMRLANQMLSTGHVQEYLQHRAAVEQELARDRPEFDTQFRADMASYLGFSLPERGRPDLAEPLIRADLEDLQRWFPRSASVAARQADLAAILEALGRDDEAQTLADAALALWQRYAGDRAKSAPGNYYLTVAARLHRLAGRLGQARQLLDMLVQPASAETGRWFQPVIEGALERARILLAQGQAQQCRDEAGAELKALRGFCRSNRLPHWEGRLLHVRGLAAEEMGDMAAAAADFDQALALRRFHDDSASLWLAELLVATARCASHTGNLTAARTALEEARRIHRQHAEVAPRWTQPLELAWQALPAG